MSLPHSKGHHLLPQYLLRGFASRISRKEHYAFVFPKAKNPREANIKDIAKKRYFHANPAETDLEHLISVKESKHATVIAKLRAANEVSPDDKALVDEFVIHLGLRTRNLRDGLAAIGDTLFNALEHKFSGNVEAEAQLEQALMQALRKELGSPPMRDLLMALPVELRKTIVTMTVAFTKSREMKNTFLRHLRDARSSVNFSAMVERTHLKALSSVQIEGAIQNRREHFAGLIWKLIVQPPGTFILGDVGPFAKYRNSAEYTQIVKVEGTLDAAVVPISSSRLLVGMREGFAYDLTANAVNTLSAELSREFYVASQNTHAQRAYSPALGKRALLVTEEELRG